MARILIIAGGARGRALAGGLVAEGHAVRITTRAESGRAAIEAVGAECWIGTPDRIATLRYALEGVTLACWLLGNACGQTPVAALHGSRLEFFVSQTIDTTVRGLVYEAAGSVAAPHAGRGARADPRAGDLPTRIRLSFWTPIRAIATAGASRRGRRSQTSSRVIPRATLAEQANSLKLVEILPRRAADV